MTIALPANLSRYFAAQNAHDAEAMADCFTPDARVRDEGRAFAGRDQILSWKKDTIAKYGIKVEPLSLNAADETATVVATVSGNFPGSPANLTYEFGLNDDGLIESLRIG